MLVLPRLSEFLCEFFDLCEEGTVVQTYILKGSSVAVKNAFYPLGKPVLMGEIALEHRGSEGFHIIFEHFEDCYGGFWRGFLHGDLWIDGRVESYLTRNCDAV